ncbi:Imm7 family immunity protein [Streptomyces cellostaticus]|nr:Imm7 family immunity protein [Streptomyces cellostaticus]GHI03916.1 hypothetical protein Scel_22370 [Streptomyces cellostaticus]
MFEYHGWISVRESADEEDEDSRSRQIAEELQEHISRRDSPCLLDLRGG